MKHSNTNWNLYRSFIVAYETKNLHRASDILGITRSGVGHNLKELSKQLGVELFVSSKKGVEPTTDAMTLYPTVKSMVDSLIEAEENLQDFNNESRAVIRIAMPSSFIRVNFKKYIKTFCEQYPKTTIEFFDKHSIHMLEKRQLDLVIRFDYILKGLNFHMLDLFSEELCFIASKDFVKRYNLCGKVSKEQLGKLPIIIRHDFINEFEATMGSSLQLKMATTTSEVTLSMAELGLGVGCYFGRLETSKEIVKLDVDDLKISKNVAVAYNKNQLTKAAKVFLEGLIDFCKL